MKRPLPSLFLSLPLSLQLIVSPVLAADTSKKSKPDFSEILNMSLEATKNVMNRSGGAQMGAPSMDPQVQQEMIKLESQRYPGPDKYFNAQKLSQIPGLTDYLGRNGINPDLLTCLTLPTTLHTSDPQVCRIGVKSISGGADNQISMLAAYTNQYKQIEGLYKNYSVESLGAENEAFGIGCMKNALRILNGFFEHRLNELDKMVTNMDVLQDKWNKDAESSLNQIEEAVAVLEGGDSELSNKVRTKKPDLFDYAKRFNNPACNSMFAKGKLNENGKAKGLNGIHKFINQELTTKPTDGDKTGQFTGESYAQMHSSVVEDINRLADKASKQFELNFTGASQSGQAYSNFLNSLQSSVTSSYQLQTALRPDKFSESQTKFNETILKLEEQKNTIRSELRSQNINAEDASNLLGSVNSGNFESEVVTIENSLKNKCFSESISNREQILNRIYDPTVSSFANKNSANFLRDQLRKILDNDKTSLESKLEKLKSLESQTKNRYYLKLDQSYEVQDVDPQGNLKSSVVSATSVRSPSLFFSDLIRNCNAQFKSNKLNNKLTGAGAIKNLRDLNRQYKNLQASQASDIKNEIKKRLIECQSPEEANNSTPGSCTSARFNNTDPNFCANAAFSCSKNMQACHEQSQGFVQKLKNQKTEHSRLYNALAEKNKRDMMNAFDSALGQFMREGEALRAVFGAGFTSPTDIEREVNPSSKDKYLNLFKTATANSEDGELLLENPKEFMKLFKKNIQSLKKNVEEQQKKILGGDINDSNGLLAKHVGDTQKNYDKIVQEATKIADACRGQIDKYTEAADQAQNKQQEEFNKKQSELGEKTGDFCKRFRSSNPNTICGGNLEEISNSVGNFELSNYCLQIQNDKEDWKNGEDSRILKAADEKCPIGSQDTDCAEYLKCTGEARCTESRQLGIAKDLLRKLNKLSALTVFKPGEAPPQQPALCSSRDNSNRSYEPYQKAMELIEQISGGKAKTQ